MCLWWVFLRGFRITDLQRVLRLSTLHRLVLALQITEVEEALRSSFDRGEVNRQYGDTQTAVSTPFLDRKENQLWSWLGAIFRAVITHLSSSQKSVRLG